MYDPVYDLQQMQASIAPASVYGGGDAYSQIPRLGGPTSLYGMSASEIYRTPIDLAQNRINLQPLARFGLESYGLPGIAASVIGNAKVGSMLREQGLVSRGTSSSYLQAITAHQRMQDQMALTRMVSGLDAGTIETNIRGILALSGVGMDPEWQEVASSGSQAIAGMGPILNAVAPQLMTMLSGRTGLASALAIPIMDANRYDMDISTGQRGYSTQSNREMAERLFQDIFSADRTAMRNGMRTEDFGAAYRLLSAEGLLQPRGTLRERTIRAARETMADTGEDLQSLLSSGSSPELASPDATVENLSADQLLSLRQNTSVQTRMKSNELSTVRDNLLAYNESLAAMKEIFGENNQPNAPYQVLVNSLKALTGNQQQKFSPDELKNLARNVQAQVRVTGMGLDDVFAMQQTANAMGTQSLGESGARFAPEIAMRMAAARRLYKDQGAMTGPDAATADAIAQAAGQLFTRTMDSEATNVYGTLGRLLGSGVEFEDNDAGRRLRAAKAAAEAGESTFSYVDEQGRTVQDRTPRTKNDFLRVASGALRGVSNATLRLALSDDIANRNFVSQNPQYMEIAEGLRDDEIKEKTVAPEVWQRLNLSEPMIAAMPDERRREEFIRRITPQLIDQFFGMTEDERKDARNVTKSLTDTLTSELRREGIQVSEEMRQDLAGTAANIPAGVDASLRRNNLGSVDVYRRASADTRGIRGEIEMQAALADALSPLSKDGNTVTQQLSAALASMAGDDYADLYKLAGRTLGIGGELSPDEATAIVGLHQEYRALSGKISQTENTDERTRLRERAAVIERRLRQTVQDATSRIGRLMGSSPSLRELHMAEPQGISLEDQRLARFGLLDMRNRIEGETEEVNSESMERRMEAIVARSSESWLQSINPLRTPSDSFPEGTTFESYWASLREADPQRAESEFQNAATLAHQQLHAERVLRSMGLLKDPRAKIRTVRDLREQLPPESPLLAAIDGATDANWATVVRDFSDVQNLSVYTKGEATVQSERDRWEAWSADPAAEAARQKAQSYYGSLSRYISGFKENVDANSNATASAKLAATGGVTELQTITRLASDYFGGDVARMIESKGKGVTDEGVAKLRSEFEELKKSPGRMQDFRNTLEDAGFVLQAGKDPTFAQYQASVPLRYRKSIAGLDRALIDSQVATAEQPELVPPKSDTTNEVSGIENIFDPKVLRSMFREIADAGKEPGGASPVKIAEILSKYALDATDSTPVIDPPGPRQKSETTNPATESSQSPSAPNPETTSTVTQANAKTEIVGTLKIVGDIIGQGTFVEATGGRI